MLARSLLRRRSRATCLRTLSTATSTSAQDWQFDYDVMVVGGGVVGSALACKLAKDSASQGHNLKIGLVEGRPPAPLQDVMDRKVPDARVYALALSSSRFLEEAGVWETIEKRAHPYTHMQVWDQKGYGCLRFDAAGAGSPVLGHVVEHSVLQSALFGQLKTLESSGSLDVLCPTEVDALSIDSSVAYKKGVGGTGPAKVGLCEIGKKEKKQVLARLVVAADGGNSKVRKLLGLSTWGWGYGQRAIVCTIKCASYTPSTAWQRYLSHGPVALLPLRDGYSSIVWSTTPEHATELVGLPGEGFLDRLNSALRSPPQPPEHINNKLADAFFRVASSFELATAAMSGATGASAQMPPLVEELCGPRLTFDLSLQQASQYTAPRVALIGDAAHTIHPMAGQGLNLGLSDASSLSKVLVSGLLGGADIGSQSLLRMYDQDRRPKNLVAMGGLDVLGRFFGSEAVSLTFARNFGLGILNGVPPVKGMLAKAAMGL